MEHQLAHDMPELIAMLARWAMEPGGLLLTLLATGFGAYFGGAAAFRAERTHRERGQRREQANAIERALFTLFRFHRIIATLSQDFVVKVEKDPNLMLVLSPTLDSGWHAIRLDISVLAFLHSTPQQMVLTKLLDRDEQFQSIAALVRERSRMVEDWIKPLAGKHSMLMPDGSPGFDLHAIVEALPIREYQDVTNVSEALRDTLKEEMAELPATQAELAASTEYVSPTLSRRSTSPSQRLTRRCTNRMSPNFTRGRGYKWGIVAPEAP